MQWLILVFRRGYRTEQRNGPHVELVGEMDGTVNAADRTTALARAKVSRPGVRVEVVAHCSWQQMGTAEKARLLGDFAIPGRRGA